MAKNSAAKIAANRRYDDKVYDKFTIRVKKDQAEKMRQAVGGGSVNGFINEAIQEKINGGAELVSELNIYAKQLNETPEEYTKKAIKERMERQDQEAEQLEHIPFFE